MAYVFNISLSVLNHLGRNLYRSFVTVIGEAISNSWDADADNVWIEIDVESRSMFIIDDGIGMNDDDFQNRFLRIGFSKRKNSEVSAKNRPYIGRKGIGKLALLSCAEKVHIASKSDGCDMVSGLIDNSDLDSAISEDASDYPLGIVNDCAKERLSSLKSGTAIYFENLNDGVINTIEYIEKIIALNFRFSLIDTSFKIYLNSKEITIDALDELASATQFVWQLNETNDNYLKEKISPANNANVKGYQQKTSSLPINGFVASTEKPSNLKIRGTGEKVTLDLYVNGRLREKDILKHIPTTRIVESYLYGQIHYDTLDYERDVFTSSREGIIADDPKYVDFLQKFKAIISGIIDDWDKERRKINEDGDPDNTAITSKRRKAQELFNATKNDVISGDIIKEIRVVDEWVTLLGEEAQFNIPSYTECFIAENLLREYIKYNSISLSKEAQNEIKRWREREKTAKDVANISYDIRKENEDIYYLDMDNLSNLVDKPTDRTKNAGVARDAVVYKPLRNAVGHTSVLTDNAKQQLNTVFNNIKARLQQKLEELRNQDGENSN
ncbi:MAG: ATP-binding protein [Lachnospiraceae bacterium]|jgi:hypothetical protein|nr:ATP-binding protein [Lachnospiraceae bacterium]